MAGPDVAYSIDQALETLATPQPQETVEAIEVALKRHWSTVLEAGRDEATSQAFSETFHRLGFLRKYKSYGVKFSSPFGYSIFTLHDGKGFSVQVHTVAKVEAFHIFAAHDTSYAIISSEADWHASSAEFLSEWSAGVLDDGPHGFRPASGDVMVIDDLGVVHAVIGCVLEEYATTSNDAVLRLHDQNVGDEVALPERHPDLREILRPLSLVPRSRVQRDRNGWQREALADTAPLTTIVDMADRGLRGYHLTLAEAHEHRTDVEPDSVTTLVCLQGAVAVEVADSELLLEPGDSVPIAPGWAATVRATQGPARVAVSVVREELAFADLRTTQ
jgi:mannose-6-phosphate isomerase-like protein (cupin superfamily)